MEKDELRALIEAKRKHLNELAAFIGKRAKEVFAVSNEMLTVSKELDQLLNVYNQLALSEKKEPEKR